MTISTEGGNPSKIATDSLYRTQKTFMSEKDIKDINVWMMITSKEKRICFKKQIIQGAGVQRLKGRGSKSPKNYTNTPIRKRKQWTMKNLKSLWEWLKGRNIAHQNTKDYGQHCPITWNSWDRQPFVKNLGKEESKKWKSRMTQPKNYQSWGKNKSIIMCS